jgi:hypothetical protein
VVTVPAIPATTTRKSAASAATARTIRGYAADTARSLAVWVAGCLMTELAGPLSAQFTHGMPFTARTAPPWAPVVGMTTGEEFDGPGAVVGGTEAPALSRTFT